MSSAVKTTVVVQRADRETISHAPTAQYSDLELNDMRGFSSLYWGQSYYGRQCETPKRE